VKTASTHRFPASCSFAGLELTPWWAERGDFAGATGSGSYRVVAEVVTFGGTFVEGTFDLTWLGTISN
jgi:hypothetical protein